MPAPAQLQARKAEGIAVITERLSITAASPPVNHTATLLPGWMNWRRSSSEDKVYQSWFQVPQVLVEATWSRVWDWSCLFKPGSVERRKETL